MAVQLAVLGDGLSRDGSFFDPALDWTKGLPLSQRETPSGGAYTTFLVLGPTDYSGDWIWLGSDPDTSNIYLEAKIGGVDTSDGPIALPLGWGGTNLYLRYKASTTTLDLLFNGVSVLSLVKDLSAVAPFATETLGTDDALPWPKLAFANNRTWQAWLTTGEIATEIASASAVRTTNLLSDTPLTSASDLTDHFSTHDWTALGTLTTVKGPLDVSIPRGSLMFAVLSPDIYSAFAGTDGQVLVPPANNPSHTPYGGPEEGIIQLPDGTICFTNFKNFEQGTFDRKLNALGEDATFDLYGIASNYADAFYGIQNGVGANIFIQKYNRKCVAGMSWSLGLVVDGARYALGVAPDESVAYYIETSASDTVTRRDLVGASSSSFATEASHTIAFRGGIVVLRNGEVLIGWKGTTNYVKHYSAAAAVLQTYSLSGNPICIAPGLDDTNFWVSYWTDFDVHFRHIRVSDGATLVDFGLGDGGATGYQWDAPFCVLQFDIGDVLPRYEDPCAMQTPLRFQVIKTPTHWTENIADGLDYFRFASAGWRDPSTRFGGDKQPRFLGAGPIVKQATDWLTGQWTAATSSPSWADTDYELRTWLSAHEGSLRGSEYMDFLWSNAQRIANGDPRILYAGKIRTDKLDANLKYGAECYDPIGYGYSVLARETMVPQRELEGDFPGYGLTGTDSPTIDFLCAPVIAGTHSDEGLSPQMGRVPQFYCGTITGLDSNPYHVGMVAGHACDEIIEVRDQDGTAVVWGTNGFAPGKTGWAAVNPSGASLYTVRNGRTYTLCLYPVGDALGDGFADGSVQLFTNLTGLTVNGDGSGGPVTDLIDQFLLVLTNFILQAWETGDWLDVPTFPYDTGRDIAIIDVDSFPAAKAIIATSYLATGLVGAFVLGLNGKQESQADILAQFVVQSHCSFARNQYHQYFIRPLDPWAKALTDLETVTDVRDTLKSLPLVAGFDEPLLANNLRGAWRMNYRTGQYEVLGQAGGGTVAAFLQFGNKVAEPELFTLIADTETVETVGLARLAFRAALRRPVTWRESFCGLRHDVLDVVLMRHFNGIGPTGYQDRALWIRKQTVNGDGSVDYEALDVDDLMGVDPATSEFLSLEVTGTAPGIDTSTSPDTVYSTFFTATAHYSDGDVDVTKIAAWSSSDPGVATVGASTGLVTSVAAGSATITATYGTAAPASVTISVVSVTLEKVAILGDAPLTGDTSNLTAWAVFSDGSIQNVTTSAAWVSTDTGIFTVGAATGVVTGVAAGTAIAQVTYSGILATRTLTIVDALAGDVHYVAPWGHDYSDGSLGAPWRTIGYGAAHVGAGGTLYVRGGTYDETLSACNSGTSWSNKVRIAAYPGETVWLTPSAGSIAILWLDGPFHYIEFDGINIDATVSNLRAVYLSTNNGFDPHHIRLKNATVIGGVAVNNDAAIVLGAHTLIGATGGFEVQNLTIHGGGVPGFGGFSYASYGVYVSGPNNLVENCDIYDTSGAGIHIYNAAGDSPDNNVIRNNRIHAITRAGDLNQVWGILSYGNNNQIYNNVIDGINVGNANPTNAGIAVNSGTGTKVWNNTIYNNTNSGIYIGGAASGTEVKNNIAYLSTGTNYVDNGTGTTASNNSTSGVDPLFVNAGAGNFRLQAGSPCLNAGATLASVPTDKDGIARPQGASYDIGAYEKV